MAEKVLAYLVTDNETARRSEPDNVQLASLLAEIGTFDPGLMEATGISEREYEELVQAIGGAAESVVTRSLENPDPPRMALTRTLDATFARFIGNENVPAENTLPANIRAVPGYYDQMKPPVKVQETNSRGNTIARYVEGTAADHFAHSECYPYSASLRAGSWGI